MLKEKIILICDICGFATDPKPMVSVPRNDATSYLPPGWCKGDTRNIDICPACAKVRRGVTLDFKTSRFARSRCPFCGDLVSVETVLDGLLFTCLNVRHCGATIRFENDHYAECMEDATAAFDRRSGAQKVGGNDHDQ